MKHTTAVFFRFLAILVVVFCGITVSIPQSAVDNEETLPVWSDISPETHSDIIAVYKKGIITGGTDGEYGIDTPMTVHETAYALVRIWEDKNGKKYTFSAYSPQDGKEYIEKAAEYEIWESGLSAKDESVSREEFAAALYPVIKDEKPLNTRETLPNDVRFAYTDQVLAFYNAGIVLDRNIRTAFSPDIKITRGEAAKLIMMYIEPDRRLEIKEPDYMALEKQLKEKMEAWQGDWSLYFEDCDTGKVISVNSHQVYSASLIKLFVAHTAYQKVAEGQIKDSGKLNDEIRKMLTYSDNKAWKYVARTLGGGSYSKGMAETTKIAQATGFVDTGQFYQGEHKNYNFTSVNDCGVYLKSLLNGTIVNKTYSDKILGLLKLQQHTQKIPKGVPDGVKTANKTGELDYIQGDAAIVYAPSGTYILVVIGDDLNNGYGQIGKITELSKMVYEFLN